MKCQNTRCGRPIMTPSTSDDSQAHLCCMNLLVARATRKTSIGLKRLPPAPKICSAAAISMGCLSPTTFFKFLTITSISSATGLLTSLILTEIPLSLGSMDADCRALSSFTGAKTQMRVAECRAYGTVGKHDPKLAHCRKGG